jgi:hypothetical protein
MYRIIETTDKQHIGDIVATVPMSSLEVTLGDGQVMEIVKWLQVSESIYKALNFNYTILIEEVA